jgi:hypothetical protein
MRERPSPRDDSSTDPEPLRSVGPCDADDAAADDDPHHESHDPYQPL